MINIMVNQYAIAIIVTFIVLCAPLSAALAACFEPDPAQAEGEYKPHPVPGDVCADGTIYAGLSPDTGTAMYTTAMDMPERGQWSDIVKEVGASSSRQGTKNVQAVKDRLFSKQSYHRLKANAIYVCDNVYMHGHGDWYLPAEAELNVLFNNRYKIKNFNYTGEFPDGLYWSSTEESPLSAFAKNFNIGYRINLDKENFVSYRCVRKDASY